MGREGAAREGVAGKGQRGKGKVRGLDPQFAHFSEPAVALRLTVRN